MRSRRSLLGAGAMIMASGCISTLPGNKSNSEGENDSQAPPWKREDSSMDLAVDNWMDSSVTAKVQFDGYSEETKIDGGTAWFSENVIESDASPEIKLTLDDGREKLVQWEPEEANENYLKFNVYSDKISFDMAEKGVKSGTSNTESESDN